MSDFSKYVIPSNTTIREALIRLNSISDDVLTLLVVDSDDCFLGSLTDGDIRRSLINGIELEDQVKAALHKNYFYINDHNLTIDMVSKIKKHLIELVPHLTEHNKILKVYNFARLKSLLPIDVVMMAGGRGERLRPLTDTVPKPLLKIGDKAIIDYNVDELLLHGIKNFFITTNYLFDQIDNHFESKTSPGISYQCVKEDKPLGTIGAVKLINNFMYEDILIMNSDLFTNIDYEDFYKTFKEEDADMAVAAIPYNINIPYAILGYEGDQIKSFQEKPSFTHYANAGIYIIKKELIGKIPVDTFFNTTDLLEVLLAENRKVIKYPIIGYWIDIGKHEDFNKAQEFAKHIKS
jgi:dTDP-glucose pyrophosphorylase